MIPRALCCLLLVGCMPPASRAPAAAPVAPTAPAAASTGDAAADDADPEQGCARLGGDGDNIRIVCNPPQLGGWPIFMTVQPGSPATVVIESFEARAATKTCKRFVGAMSEFADDGRFEVTCDDDTAQFRFATTFVAEPGTTNAWVNDHLERRQAALATLKTVDAVPVASRSQARVTAQDPDAP